MTKCKYMFIFSLKNLACKELTDDQSTFVQVMACCRQATSHHLSNVDPDLCHHMASSGHNELRLLIASPGYISSHGIVEKNRSSSLLRKKDPSWDFVETSKLFYVSSSLTVNSLTHTGRAGASTTRVLVLSKIVNMNIQKTLYSSTTVKPLI